MTLYVLSITESSQSIFLFVVFLLLLLLVTVVVVLIFCHSRNYTQAKQDGKYYEYIQMNNFVIVYLFNFINCYQTAQANEEEDDYTEATLIPHRAPDAVRYFCYSLH